jgi:hypothetical protein
MANLDQYGQPLRDPASAVLQRKYALAQALQKQGMDTSPTVGTGNTTMQAIARVLQGGLGGYLSSRVEGEAQDASDAQKAERARRESLILGLTTGQTPGAAPAAAPDAPAAAPPMTERLGGAPPVEGPAPVPQVQQQPLPAPGAAMSPETAALQRQAESGGDPNARNPRSSATGADQFIDSTWLQYAAANPDRFPGMSREQILAKRTDEGESGRATQWYAGQNGQALASAGLPNGPGETTLAHRFGAGGAIAALRADPNAPAAQVFGADVMRANPDLAGKTVGQVVQQYQSRYGVAARTGGTDMAGPGVPAAPAAAPTAPPAGGRTPDQLRTAAAQVAALGGTAAQAQALYAQADAIERRQFQTETRTATDARAKVDDARADEQLRLARDAGRRQEEDARLRRDSTDWIPDPAKPGALMPRPGGPQDPAVIQQRAQAATAGRPTPAAPATATAGMLENVSAVRKIDDTLAELTRRAGSGVGWSGYVPGVIHNRTDPEGVTLRALISDIGSLKLHDRSGANVTASEAPRLTPFIPSVTDDARTIRDKLTNFRREYLSALNDQYEAHGPAAGNRPIPPVEAFLQANPITPRNAEAPAGAGGAMPALPPGFTVVR